MARRSKKGPFKMKIWDGDGDVFKEFGDVDDLDRALDVFRRKVS